MTLIRNLPGLGSFYNNIYQDHFVIIRLIPFPMRTSFKPSRLSNLYKPLVILLSTYALVNLVGFFVQHNFSKPSSSNCINNIQSVAGKHLIFEERIVVTPAPPRMKIQPEKKILPSGETE
jgi:hypothetical protein